MSASSYQTEPESNVTTPQFPVQNDTKTVSQLLALLDYISQEGPFSDITYEEMLQLACKIVRELDMIKQTDPRRDWGIDEFFKGTRMNRLFRYFLELPRISHQDETNLFFFVDTIMKFTPDTDYHMERLWQWTIGHRVSIEGLMPFYKLFPHNKVLGHFRSAKPSYPTFACTIAYLTRIPITDQNWMPYRLVLARLQEEKFQDFFSFELYQLMQALQEYERKLQAPQKEKRSLFSFWRRLSGKGKVSRNKAIDS